MRSEYAANLAIREALAQPNRTHAVRLIYTAKRRRDIARERRARLAYFVIIAATMCGMFYSL